MYHVYCFILHLTNLHHFTDRPNRKSGNKTDQDRKKEMCHELETINIYTLYQSGIVTEL